MNEEQKERLEYLREEQRKNKLCNHAMAVDKLRELIYLIGLEKQEKEYNDLSS